jgi:hypothetical protein
VDAPCGQAAVTYQPSLRFRQEEGDGDEVCACENHEEPKDPSPAKFLGQDTGDDRAEAWGCSSAGEDREK